MISRYVVPLVVLIGAAPAAAQSSAPGAERRIAVIRDWYGDIQDSVALFVTREKPFDHPGGVGAIVTSHDAAGALRKMVLTFESDGSDTRAEYFFRDGELFFVHSRTETFPLWPDQDPADFGADEDRYYFDGDRLVRWLVTYHDEAMRPRVVPPAEHAERADLVLRRAQLLRRFVDDDRARDLFDFDPDGIAF